MVYPCQIKFHASKWLKSNSHLSVCIIAIEMPQSLRLIQIVCGTFLLLKMRPFIGNDKVTFENCGSKATRKNLARHRKRCSFGKLFSAKCPNCPRRSQADLNFHNSERSRAYPSQKKVISVIFVTEFPFFSNYTNRKGKTRDMQWVRKMLIWHSW